MIASVPELPPADAAPSSQPSNPQPSSAQIPRATYRLQLHGPLELPGGQRRRFDFRDAARAVPYLSRLGISTLYLSPIWQATPGSSHGYDATDHSRVASELGGEKGLRRLWDVAKAHGMTMIADFVPNHMGIAGGHNPYWEDVLRHGQASRYAHFFDISWQPLKRALSGKVLLPVLGDQYGRVLERHELSVVRQDGELGLKYFERVFPLSPRLNAPLLTRAWELCELPEGNEDRLDLASLALQAANLPRSSENLTDEDRESRARESAVIERRLSQLSEISAVNRALSAAMAELNADAMRLDELIRGQNYRLSYWKVASEQINYRRFFDINDLAALRVEDPRVFEWAHSKLFELVKEGVIAGVRLDHTDGLYDPAGYFEMLQRKAAGVLNLSYQPGDRPLYVLAEKILEPGEHLPDWPIYGTTGYDFLAQLGGVFVESANEDEISSIYRRFTGERRSYGQILHDTKQLIQRVSLASEVNVLSEQLEQLAEADLRWRDFTLSSLREVLREVIAAFPVYRTYVRPSGRESGDNAKIAHAIRDARKLNRDLDASLFDFLQSVLTLDAPNEAVREQYADFAFKFQQLTGPVTAKGAEDTAFYRYGRLLSLNEVGGDPAIFGTSPRSFHAQTRERSEKWPHAMIASSTHDTKRGEDTRARISVLSEVPQLWASYLNTWGHLARPLQSELPDSSGGGRAPSNNDLFMFFQQALGVWPLDGNTADLPDRLSAATLKAAREAKVQTSWAAPDQVYEEALDKAVRGLLASPEFAASMTELHHLISPYAAQNGLSATLIRLTAPGVPDTYQGGGGWNESLVDPDNRRPVDYARLSAQLRRIEERYAADPLTLAQDLLGRYQTGSVKLLMTWAALQTRAQHPDLFALGSYQALSGGKYLLAFARQHGSQLAVSVAPRLSATLTKTQTPWALGESWGNRSLGLPSGTYHSAITNERFRVRGDKIALAKLLEFFPAALLIRE